MPYDLQTALRIIDRSHDHDSLPPESFALLTAPADDPAFVPTLLRDITAFYPQARVLLVEAPATGPQEPLRRLLTVLAPALQTAPPCRGRETHRVSHSVQRQLQRRVDFLVVDHAERLGYAALNFLRRDQALGMVPVLLVSRNAARMNEALKDGGFWQRALTVNWGDRP